MASSSLLVSSILLIFFLISSSSIVESIVSPSNRFKYVNAGEFGYYLVEYGAHYRELGIQTFPFALCFYNNTPNAYTLGLRMGSTDSKSIMRWVWDANRGNPVKENAMFSFGRDGNLMLADADGKVAWQTGTANKGVTDLKLLSNGNLVLLDSRGSFVWQSFDHPTDTLLVGQSLRPSGPSKLVSRVSATDGSEGAYSFVLEKNDFALYQQTKNSLKPFLYCAPYPSFSPNSHMTLNIEVVNDGFSFEVNLVFGVGNFVGNSSNGGTTFLTIPKYNATLTMFRLESDGNMKIYTYNDKVDWNAWEVTFTLFSRDGGGWQVSECKLPSRCGSLGVCEDNQCVACPTPKGLLGWSKDCAPPKRNGCGEGQQVNYYKVVGVEHYMVSEGEGPMKVDQCKEKCDKDCGCLGFFYRKESSKCLLAPELGTLSKVSNPFHVAYIKM